MKSLQAIIFDCFGVLYLPIGEDFYASHIPADKRDQIRQLGRQADLGDISQQQFVNQVATLSGLGSHEVENQVLGNLVRNNALLKFSQSLRPKYKIGMLSNISSSTMEKFFKKSECEQLFDAVVISSEVGMAKPDVAIFELTAERLGVEVGCCVMVDDSWINCSGAIEAGMKALKYQSTQQVIKDIEVLLI